MRLFVALPLPEDIREALLDPMEGLVGARWQDADNLHITLRFIGEISRHQADDIACALADVAWRNLTLSVRGVGHFEKKGQPNAIFAQVIASPELGELQQAIEHACRRAGFAGETRKFIPHVTLARLGRASGDIVGWLTRHAGLALGPWQADGFGLFASTLVTGESVYEELLRFPAPIRSPFPPDPANW